MPNCGPKPTSQPQAVRAGSSPETREGADQRRLVRTLKTTAVVIGLAVFPPLLNAVRHGPRSVILILLLQELCLSLVYALSSMGRVGRAAHLLCYATVVFSSGFLVVSDRGLHNSALAMFPLSLLIGALLLSRKAFVPLACFTGFCFTLIAGLQKYGILYVNPVHVPDSQTFIDTAVILIVTAVVSGLLACHLRASLSAAALYSQALQFLISATSNGQTDFFQSLGLGLGKVLGVQYVIIGELRGGEMDRVETIAFVANGSLGRNFAYELAGAPCADGVRNLFPHDPWLADMSIESYIGTPLRNNSGRPIGLIAVLHSEPIKSPILAQSLLNIFAVRAAAELERRYAETALRESEQRYRLILRNLGEGIVTMDAAGEFLMVNPAAERIFGVAPGSLPGRRLSGFCPPDAPYEEPAPQPGQTAGHEFAIVGDDGVRRQVHLTRWPQVPSFSDRPVSLALLRDVTESKKMAEHVRLLAWALGSARDCICICDAHDRILYVNAFFLRSYGYSADELLGKCSEVFSAAGTPFAAGRMANWDGELLHRASDGREFPVWLTVSMVFDEAGQYVAHIAVARDMTSQRAMQYQYLQAQKLEGIGRLAGGIAHDFNNLLTVINGYADMLVAVPSQDALTRHRVSRIHFAGQRASELTRQLLAFSRKQVCHPVALDLGQLVRDSEDFLRRLVGGDVSLVTDPGPGHLMVESDPRQLHQILLNLAINSRDAMPEGGVFTIKVCETELYSGSADNPANLPPGPYILLEVADTGTGMTEETRSHMFEPFFSTRGANGTGLGLATVHGIVHQNRGGVHVLTRRGAGATFRIWLPQLAGDPAPVSGDSRDLAASGPGTILVVEDHEGVRDLVTSVLRAAGYHVLSTDSAEDALDIVLRQSDPIHLLLTDMVLPGMNGRELAERFVELQPATRVLFTSGYTGDAFARRGISEGRIAFLPKPYTAEQLAVKVSEVLR
jgi:two-component system cell cycle sensor histidine kinase/response regulator CckA